MATVPNNKLKKNFNEWAIFSIINNTKLEQDIVLAWKIIGGKKIIAELKIKLIKKFHNEIVLIPINQESKKILEDLIKGSDNLNFFIQGYMVLFRTNIKEYNYQGLTVIMPNMIAQLDRRKYLRLKVKKDQGVKVEFLKKVSALRKDLQKFDRNCFDISAGGLSFFVSGTEYSFFRKNDEIPILVLSIGKYKMKISADVVNIIEEKPNDRNGLFYKSWKICLQYSQIEENSRDFINDFVFRNSDISEDTI